MKILFGHQEMSSFVEKDLRILEQAHEVREYRFRGVRDLPGLVQNVMWCDITFSWFGKLHAFYAVLFSKLLRKVSHVGDERGLLCKPAEKAPRQEDFE
jgi:hypothetical protein